MSISSLLVFIFVFVAMGFYNPSIAFNEPYIGVNLGTSLSNMPDSNSVVSLLKAQQIRHLRLYDASQSMLLALANTGISVIVSVPNDEVIGIGKSNVTASNWVSHNILPYVPATKIIAIAVGSEILTTLTNAAIVLVPAMQFIHSALVSSNLDSKIKVSCPQSSSIILDSFPPSQAFFNSTWDLPVIDPLLDFLNSTASFLMLNVYPYYDYMQSKSAIPLDYALFRPLVPNKEAVDSNTLLRYTNVFDAIVDAAYFAMSSRKFYNIPIIITESGWPSKGDPSEKEATSNNAITYNSNLIRHVLNGSGTPKQPGISLSTYIYELYNEDLRSGESEENWGLFYSNGHPVYTLRLNGSGMVFTNDTTNQTFCVAKPGSDQTLLQVALDWACGPGKVDCGYLLKGNVCYVPNTVEAHATYAFNAYYQKYLNGESCNFQGVAIISGTDPSHGLCVFPRNKNRFRNTSTLVPSSNSTFSGCSSKLALWSDVGSMSSMAIGVLLWIMMCFL